jgi:hypothetical protein
MRPDERRGLVYVAMAVALLSTSPVLVVWADPVNPVVKTWLRLVVAALAVGITARIFASRQTIEPPTGKVSLRFFAYGLIAALHIVFYIASLSFTTPAHSLSIV